MRTSFAVVLSMLTSLLHLGARNLTVLEPGLTSQPGSRTLFKFLSLVVATWSTSLSDVLGDAQIAVRTKKDLNVLFEAQRRAPPKLHPP